MNPSVLYEEKDFAVINKPAGLIVHGASPSLVEWLLEKYPEVAAVGDKPEERAGIVHRLDKDTSGVMIIPRTQEAFVYFKDQFQQHNIKKIYKALVYGSPREREGVIDKPIGLVPDSVRRTVFVKRAKMVKDAVTKYGVVKTFEIDGVQVSLIRAEPLTGRTHQIRVHLDSIGCPIVGDKLYGPKKPAIVLACQFLHAESIEFTAPSGKALVVSAPLPEELQKLIG